MFSCFSFWNSTFSSSSPWSWISISSTIRSSVISFLSSSSSTITFCSSTGLSSLTTSPDLSNFTCHETPITESYRSCILVLRKSSSTIETSELFFRFSTNFPISCISLERFLKFSLRSIFHTNLIICKICKVND